MFYIFETASPIINISIFDLFLVPLLIIILVFIASSTTTYKSMSNNMQSIYIRGLIIKLVASILFSLVHIIYYGGDTGMYFTEIIRLKNLALQDFGSYLNILFNGSSDQAHSYFNNDIGFPMRGIWGDSRSYMVPRVCSPIGFISFNSFIITNILLSRIIYFGLWKLFLVITEIYPDKTKIASWAILFTPSVLFWGSGILKDSICLALVGLYTYGFYTLFLKKQIKISAIFFLIISVSALISIKPYIFVAILPGSMLWLSFGTIKKIKNPFFKTLSIPFILIITYLGFTFIFSSFSSSLGAYGNIDSMVKKAKITKDDHTRTQYAYSENYYDIGEMDGTLSGSISKAPQAIVAGLFQPFIWEARNPFILISGIENLIFLFLFFRMFVKSGVKSVLSNIFNEPIIFFCLFFSLFFAFSVGLATANFGALVRLRTPMIPFFVFLLLYLNNFQNFSKKESLKNKTLIKIKH